MSSVNPETLAIGGAVVVAGVGAYFLLGSSKPPVVLTADEQAKLDAAKKATDEAERKAQVDQQQYDQNKAAIKATFEDPANPISQIPLAPWAASVVGAALDWSIQGDAKPDPNAVKQMDDAVNAALQYLKTGNLDAASAAIEKAKYIRHEYWISFGKYAVVDRIDPNLQPADVRLANADIAVKKAIDLNMTSTFNWKTANQALKNRALVDRLSPDARKLFDAVAPAYDLYLAKKDSTVLSDRVTARMALLRTPSWFQSQSDVQAFITQTADDAEKAKQAVFAATSSAASTVKTIGAGLEHLLADNAYAIMAEQWVKMSLDQQKAYTAQLTQEQRDKLRQAILARKAREGR